MYQRVILGVIILWGLMLTQKVNADIKGKVSDGTGKPIAGATVSLLKKGVKVTSGTDGKYIFGCY